MLQLIECWNNYSTPTMLYSNTFTISKPQYPNSTATICTLYTCTVTLVTHAHTRVHARTHTHTHTHTCMHARICTCTCTCTHTHTVMCGSPPSLENGMVSFDNTIVNSLASYTCNEGYNFAAGSSTIRFCTGTGEWSDVTITCQRKSVCLCVCVCKWVCLHVCICVCVCARVSLCMCVGAHMCVWGRGCGHTCVCCIQRL